MSREAHAGFCERRRVRLPPPTLLVVLVHGTRADVEALREEVAGVLAPLGLRRSPSKTRVAHLSDGFDFLGFHIRWKRKRGTTKWHVYTFIADRPVQALKHSRDGRGLPS